MKIKISQEQFDFIKKRLGKDLVLYSTFTKTPESLCYFCHDYSRYETGYSIRGRDGRLIELVSYQRDKGDKTTHDIYLDFDGFLPAEEE